MKKFVAAILTIVLLLTLAACGGTPSTSPSATPGNTPNNTKTTFIVGMECDYAPFNWTQADESETSVPISSGGYADGYDVQIAKKIAEGLGLTLVIEKIEWDGLTSAVDSGVIDAIIAGMSPKEERKATIDFTDPYYESDLVIVVRKDGPYANAATLEDFSCAKITGQQNTVHYDVIDQIPGVQQQTALTSFPVMILALTSGTIDGYVSERPGALSAMSANPELMFVAFGEGEGFVAPPEEVTIAVGLKKGSDELCARINEVLAGIGEEERVILMSEALDRQPLSED